MTLLNDTCERNDLIKDKFRQIDTFYYFYLFILCMLFYIRDVHEMNIPLVIYLVFSFIGYAFFDYSQAVAFTAAMPLLNHGIQTNYIVIIAILFYLIKYGANLRLNKIHAIVIFLMSFELLHSIIEPFSFSEYLRYLVQYIYIALILGESRIKVLLKRPSIIIKTFIIVAMYFMLDVVLVTSKYVPLQQILITDFRFGSLSEFLKDKPSLFDNENMVALFAIVAISLLLVLIETSKKYRVLKILLVMYFIFFGLMTSSKTFLLCLVIVILFYFYNAMKYSLTKMLGIALGISCILVIMTNTVFKDLFERVLERFMVDDITTGRSTLMRLYNEYIFSDLKHVLFGIGLQSVSEKTGIFNTPHNGLQETLLCWGVIGIAAIIMLFVCIFSQAKKYPNTKKIINYMPFFIFLIFIQTIQLVRLPNIFGLLIVLYVAMLCGKDNDEKDILYNNG